jgi:hypothetical protein
MLRLTIALCLILAAPAAAKPGDLDRTFGTGGRIAFAVGDGYASAGDMLLGRDGSLLISGEGRSSLPPGPHIAAARLTVAGRLDPAFGSGGRLLLEGGQNSYPMSGGAQLVAPLAGGAAIVAAAVETGGHVHADLYRIDSAGRQDMTFGGGHVTVTGEPHLVPVALAARRGKILMLATIVEQGFGAPERAELIRLDEDGRIENRRTIGTGVSAAAMLVDARGTVVATTVAGRSGHPARVRLTTLGRRSSSIALHYRGSEDVGAVAILRGPGRTLYVAGNDASGGSWGGRHWPWLARVGADGRIDWRSTPVGRRSDFSVRAAALDRRGRVVLAGTRGSIDLGSVSTTVMRITRAGRRDPRLGVKRLQLGAQKGVLIIGSEPRAVAIDARGRIVLAGVAFDDDVAIREDLGRSYFAVARLMG